MNVGSHCLVTGANGFIGKILCNQLRKKGKVVRALLRRESAGPWEESIIGDLSSTSLPHECLSGVDTIFHLAGKAHALSENIEEASAYQRINVDGTKLILEAAVRAHVCRFIFFSSVKAIGEGEKTVLDESDHFPPETPYGRSKLDAEHLVLNTTTIPHVTVLRPTMVYGPENPGNLRQMIDGIQKGFFPPFPNITNRRSMVHVNDMVQAAILAAESSQAHKQVYIVTDDQAYSTRQIYEWICQALGKPIPNWSVPLSVLQGLAKIGDGIGLVRGKRFIFNSDVLTKLTGSAIYSSAKIQRELGFVPKWSLDQSLPTIVQSLIRK